MQRSVHCTPLALGQTSTDSFPLDRATLGGVAVHDFLFGAIGLLRFALVVVGSDSCFVFRL